MESVKFVKVEDLTQDMKTKLIRDGTIAKNIKWVEITVENRENFKEDG